MIIGIYRRSFSFISSSLNSTYFMFKRPFPTPLDTPFPLLGSFHAISRLRYSFISCFFHSFQFSFSFHVHFTLEYGSVLACLDFSFFFFFFFFSFNLSCDFLFGFYGFNNFHIFCFTYFPSFFLFLLSFSIHTFLSFFLNPRLFLICVLKPL